VHVLVRTEPAFGHREEQLRRKELEGRMRELLWTVQKLVNSHRDHLPKEVMTDRTAPVFMLNLWIEGHTARIPCAGPQRLFSDLLSVRH